MLLTAGWVLAGCSTLSSMNPVNWWHRQEGGKIAEDRPAPPGVDQPYPNMSTVPPKPAPVDQEAMKQLTDSLVADRTNAQHAAQSAPLADPSSPTASPGLFGVGTAPPPPPPGATIPGAKPSTTSPSGAAPSGATPPAESGSSGTPVASASMPAVTAPAAPPSPAPRKAVQSTPLEAPPTQTAPTQTAPAQTGPTQTGPDRTATAPAATTPGQAAATPAQTSASPAAASPAVPGSSAGAPPAAAPDSTIAGPSPTLPSAPPPRPFAAGAPAAMPVVPAPMPAPAAGQSAAIVFLERASNLSSPAADEVKAFAAKRGNGTISVVGYGDSTSSDPDSQSAALNLGLSRAQSIVDALKAAGVPGNAIRVSAEASGRGASLQLLQ